MAVIEIRCFLIVHSNTLALHTFHSKKKVPRDVHPNKQHIQTSLNDDNPISGVSRDRTLRHKLFLLLLLSDIQIPAYKEQSEKNSLLSYSLCIRC